MLFRYAIFYVPSVVEALEFYRDAFGFAIETLHESGDFGQLETGSTVLAFSSLRLMEQLGKSPGRPDPAAPIGEIAFETEDVSAALLRAVGAGAELVQDVRQEAWGQTTAYVRDPNGFLVEICSPVTTLP